MFLAIQPVTQDRVHENEATDEGLIDHTWVRGMLHVRQSNDARTCSLCRQPAIDYLEGPVRLRLTFTLEVDGW